MADATQVQRRRGTQSQCEAGTPVEGEIWVDTTLDTLRVGDGSKAGGFLMPNAEHIQESTFNFASAVGADALSVTLFPVPDNPSTGFSFKFRAAENNTGSVTVSLNGASPIEIRKIQGSAIVPLEENDLIASGIYEVNHNGVYYLLNSPIPVVRNDYEFVGRFTPSGANRFFEILNVFEVGYNYEIDFVGLGVSTNSSTSIGATFSSDGGTSWLSNYSTSGASSPFVSMSGLNGSNTSLSSRSFSKFILNDPRDNSSARVHSMEYSSSPVESVNRLLVKMGGPNSLIGVDSIRIGAVGVTTLPVIHGYANVWRKRAV